MVDKRIELHENVVSTDYIEGSTLHYFTYATEWTDREHVIKFDTVDQAIDWYAEHLRDRAIDQGRYWLEEDEWVENEYRDEPQCREFTDEDAVNEWRTLVECTAHC